VAGGVLGRFGEGGSLKAVEVGLERSIFIDVETTFFFSSENGILPVMSTIDQLF
jgi:hypothetical protein